jgi:hypothetical protein
MGRDSTAADATGGDSTATDATVTFVKAAIRRGQQVSEKSSELLGERIRSDNWKPTKSWISKESDQVLSKGKFV